MLMLLRSMVNADSSVLTVKLGIVVFIDQKPTVTTRRESGANHFSKMPSAQAVVDVAITSVFSFACKMWIIGLHRFEENGSISCLKPQVKVRLPSSSTNAKSIITCKRLELGLMRTCLPKFY